MQVCIKEDVKNSKHTLSVKPAELKYVLRLMLPSCTLEKIESHQHLLTVSPNNLNFILSQPLTTSENMLGHVCKVTAVRLLFNKAERHILL